MNVNARVIIEHAESTVVEVNSDFAPRRDLINSVNGRPLATIQRLNSFRRYGIGSIMIRYRVRFVD